jgi:hypothetical protein
LKTSKKKLKSSIEELFGKGKRLPVFSGITTANVVGEEKKMANPSKK